MLSKIPWREEMTTEKVRDNTTFAKNNILWQLFLIIAPWLVFWVQNEFYPHLLRLIDPTIRVPVFISLAPLEILLLVGILIAWKRRFPLWSYTWIGILYFFSYRAVFDLVIDFSRNMPENLGGIIQGVFYGLINPLGLALVLAVIARRDWLLGCLAAYPITSIIMAWYTLDRTPFLVYLVSLVLYVLFALLFLALQSRTLKFISLLAGTLIIGGGFFVYNWGGIQTLLFIVVRNILILVLPLIFGRSASRFALTVRNLANRFAQRGRRMSSMSRRRKLLLSVAIVVLVVGFILTSIGVYSGRQLRILRGQAVYATPEDGMQELIANHYSGVERVDLVHASESIFADLWFVEAHVWATSRTDGKGFSSRGYDNPGWHFLRVQNGWVFVPESRFPEVVAFGKWLFGLSG